MLIITLLIVGGLILLVVGGEILVSAAVKLAARFGISTLIIGLTVVAFSTSAPELMVTLDAAWRGGSAADLAMGNIIGSNIFNVLFILGLCALVSPLVVEQRMVRVEVPLMIAASVALLWVARDGSVDRFEGGALFAALLVYVWLTVQQARKTAAPVGDDDPSRPVISIPRQLLALAGGLVLLVLGARLLVSGAIDVATLLGLSETVIGLTIVAAGTSLPEVAASVIATVRGQRDLAVGNIVGSNIFNIFAVMGLSALIAPIAIPAPDVLRAFDGPVMLAVALVCLPVFFTGHRVERWEGGVFLGYYIAYVAYLILAATRHTSLETYGNIMLVWVVPLTVLTLLISLSRTLLARWKQRA